LRASLAALVWKEIKMRRLGRMGLVREEEPKLK
jgi:hypothetical protein